MSNFTKGKKIPGKMKATGDHSTFLNRITKSLYYAKLPRTDRLSLPVTEFAAELFSEIKSGCSLERLDVDEASRISRNACVSPCSFVLALLYLERLKDCNPEYLYKVAPSELFLVSLMVASKFLNDDGEEDEVFNVEWAKSGDLTLAHMNRLEKEFLNAINWAIYVYDDDFWNRLKKLEEYMAHKEAQKRGWYSYTELSCLVNVIDIATILQTLLSVSSICVLTYTAGILTLLGSALITSHIPGTSLASKQSPLTSSNNSTTTRLISSETLQEDTAEENLLLEKFVQNNLSCTDCDLDEYLDHKQVESIGWNWLPSLNTWLPKYSIFDAVITPSKFRDDKLYNIASFITNSQTLLRDRFEWEDLTLQVNWRDSMSVNLEYSPKNWQYYVEYLTKISLGHQH